MLVDEVLLNLQAGRGGDGVVSFRREKFVPRGGPDGGNGGTGGSIFLIASRSHNTLAQYRYRPGYRAERGRNGEGSRRKGRSGVHTLLDVPIGTLVFDAENGELLGDLTEGGQRLEAARGGKGGRGNATFVTSTNQAPRRSDDGEAGESTAIRLELRLLADVGLVGFPNAGKSTFISRVSAARPRIADYPFTTLEPNLGVVDFGDEDGFVIADIPGLIPGASEGAGLGHRFLRHLTRTSILAMFIDVSEASLRDPVEDLEALGRELAAYGRGLESKPRLIVANKTDALNDEPRLSALSRRAHKTGLDFFAISSVTGEGIHKLLGALKRHVTESQDDSSGSAHVEA